MATINAAKFKEQCLHLIDHLGAEGVVITKHGKPVAKVIPIESSCSHLIGSLRGKIRIKGDTFATGVEWNAESGIVFDKPRTSRKRIR